EYEQGKELFAAGRYGEALTCFERAVNAEPENDTFKFARGRTRLKLGQDASGALGDFKSVFEARPDDPRAEQALAYCHLLLDQLDPAIDHRTTAERSRVKTPGLYNNRAYAYRRRNAAAKIGEKADWDKALLC